MATICEPRRRCPRHTNSCVRCLSLADAFDGAIRETTESAREQLHAVEAVLRDLWGMWSTCLRSLLPLECSGPAHSQRCRRTRRRRNCLEKPLVSGRRGQRALTCLIDAPRGRGDWFVASGGPCRARSISACRSVRGLALKRVAIPAGPCRGVARKRCEQCINPKQECPLAAGPHQRPQGGVQESGDRCRFAQAVAHCGGDR